MTPTSWYTSLLHAIIFVVPDLIWLVTRAPAFYFELQHTITGIEGFIYRYIKPVTVKEV